MLKVRLIPSIITKGDLVVQSFGFNKYLPIGNIKTAIEFFVNWDVDEIVILDIDASKANRSPNFELVEWAARECFVPLTVGGGITSMDDIDALLKAGADKVCLNGVVLDQPEFIHKAASVYGSQCITVSIDAVMHNGSYRVYDYRQKSALEIDVTDFAEQCELKGAGEIFLNSVDRDGSRQGYDTTLLNEVSKRVSIPVIACGGVGKMQDFAAGVKEGGCQAVSAANIFQHFEHSTIAAKAQLKRDGVPVRLSSAVKYDNFMFDSMGRPY